MLAHFQQGGQQPEVEMYRHLRHFTGPCTELFPHMIYPTVFDN